MITEPEFFPTEAVAQDSPRLKWMKKHNAVTFLSRVEPFCWFAGFADEPVADKAEWFCTELGKNGDTQCGVGTSEDEALVELAKKYAVKLWNEEDTS